METKNFLTGALARYGEPDIFKRRLDEGYDEAAFGAGFTTDSLLKVWVFFRPGGDVKLCEYRRLYRGQDYAGPFETALTKGEFEAYSKIYGFCLTTEKKKLDTLLEYLKMLIQPAA